METLYKRIERLSYERKSTVARTEKEAGLSKGAISKWKSCSPRIESLNRVAEVLGVTLDELVREA